MFKTAKEITNEINVFTEKINKVKDLCKGYFASYDNGMYKTDNLSEFISSLDGDIFEDEKGDLFVRYYNTEKNKKRLFNFLAEYDIISFERKIVCDDVELSNLLNSL